MYGDEIPRDRRGRFRKGKPGGPGRPYYGSLTKIKAPLGFLRDAVANWERHGEAALTRLRLTDPMRYFLFMVAIETDEFRVQRRGRAKGPDRIASRSRDICKTARAGGCSSNFNITNSLGGDARAAGAGAGVVY
jgi:hypothetical protein